MSRRRIGSLGVAAGREMVGRRTLARMALVAAGAAAFLASARSVAAQASTPTPPIIIILPTRTRTPTLPVIIIQPSRTPTPGGSGPRTWTPTPSRTPTGTPSHTPLPSATPPPSPTDLPLVILSPTPTELSLTLSSPTPTDLPLTGPDVPDLITWGLEVTQGMQDLGNRMPLVAGRRTYARVYVYTDGGDYPNVMAALGGWRNGQPLPGSPLFPENGPITAHPNGGERTALDDSLYFYLPPSWRSGEIVLRAFAYAGDVDAPFEEEPDGENNLRETSAEFHPASVPGLWLFPLHVHLDYSPGSPETTYDGSAAGPIVADIYRLLPIAGLDVDVSTVTLYPADHADGVEWDFGPCRTTLSQDVHPYNLSFFIDDASTLEPDDYIQIGTERMQVNSVSGANVFVDRGMSGTSVAELHPEGAIVHLIRCNSTTDNLGAANTVLAWYRALLGIPESILLYGMVDPIQPFGPFRGMADGDGDAMGWMDPSTDDDHPWHMLGGSIVAHELAHNAGLLHVGCKDDNGDGIPDEIGGGPIDLTHPTDFPNCSLAPIDPLGFFGFDVYWELWPELGGPTAISNDPNFAAPNQAYPLMSYRGAKWLDPYHYCRLLVYLDVPCAPEDLGFAGGDVPPGVPGAEDLTAGPDPFFPPDEPLSLQVGGTIDPQQNEGSLDFLFRLADRRPAPSIGEDPAPDSFGTEPEYWLTVEDAQGGVLARLSLAEHGAPHESIDAWAFSALLPLPEGSAFVRLWRGDLLLAERARSAYAPIVQAFDAALLESAEPIAAVDWAASDPDGDRLTFLIEYTPDDGHTWQPAGVYTSEPTPVQLSLAGLPASPAGLLRISASDGFDVASMVSGPLAVPASPPIVWILTPSDGAVVPLGARVTFQGAAGSDVGADGRVEWTSGRDGPLGEGWELSTRSLSGGLHTITLTVTDGAGLAAQASVRIAVDPAVTRSTPPPDWEQSIAEVFAGERPQAGLSARLPVIALAIAVGGAGVAALLGAAVVLWLVRRGRVPR